MNNKTGWGLWPNAPKRLINSTIGQCSDGHSTGGCRKRVSNERRLDMASSPVAMSLGAILVAASTAAIGLASSSPVHAQWLGPQAKAKADAQDATRNATETV